MALVVLSVAAIRAMAADKVPAQPPPVVTCELRWIEAPRADVNKLFAPVQYVVDADQSRTIDEWIAKKQATIVDQSRISTISGAQAQVRSVVEFLHPTAATRMRDDPADPRASSWRTREVGTIVNVTPIANAASSELEITLVPALSTFLGWRSYALPNAADRPAVNQPEFQNHVKETAVRLRSGQTVLLAIFNNPTGAEADTVLVLLLSAAIPKLEGKPTP